MSGSLAAVIVIPIATMGIIAVWVFMVLRASSRRPPEHGPGSEPAKPVAGGTFRGDPRQLMPNPEAPAASNAEAPSAASRAAQRLGRGRSRGDDQ